MKQKQRAQIPIGMTLYVGQGESERGEEVRWVFYVCCYEEDFVLIKQKHGMDWV